MKRITFLVGVLLLAAGCVAEDSSFCPPVQMGVTLHFRLPDPATRNGDTFKEEITTVTTAIYNATGELVQTVVTNQTDHNAFQGLQLSLVPDTYRVVSWGNVVSGTRINDLNTPYDVPTWLDYAAMSDGRMVSHADPLFYAPYTRDGEYEMVVDAETGHEGTLDFRHAHRTVEIFVEGFVSSDKTTTTPVVRLTGLPAGLEFLGMGNLDQETVTSQLRSRPVTVRADGYALSSFDTFYFHLADFDIGVELIDPATGDVVYTTKLNDHLDAAADQPEIERTVRLLLSLKSNDLINVEVGVSIPKWGENEVQYDFE